MNTEKHIKIAEKLVAISKKDLTDMDFNGWETDVGKARRFINMFPGPPSLAQENFTGFSVSPWEWDYVVIAAYEILHNHK